MSSFDVGEERNSRNTQYDSIPSECSSCAQQRRMTLLLTQHKSSQSSLKPNRHHRSHQRTYVLIFACLTGCLVFLTLNNFIRNAVSRKIEKQSTCPFNRYIDPQHGIFWSDDAEATLPRELASHSQQQEQHQLIDTPAVVQVLSDTCGRMQNRELVLADKTRLCLRYRVNIDQIQGEIFARQLARELRLADRYLPPSALWRLNLTAPLWARVSREVAGAGWPDGGLAVVTRFEPGLKDVFIPELLRSVVASTDSRPNGIHPSLLHNLTNRDVAQLMQWSDLLLFDFLTANQDRFVSSLINHQWNRQIMTYPAHNLARIPATSQHRGGPDHLIFLDHEAAFFHGYRLLSRYGDLHRNALSRVCIFRKQTLTAVHRLAALTGHDELERLLVDGIRASEGQTADHLPTLTNHNARIFKNRLDHVIEHVRNCERRQLKRKC